MRAIVCKEYGQPDVLQLEEVQKPIPKNSEVLIKIHATTVSTSDCLIRGFEVAPFEWLLMRLVLGITRPRRPILGTVFAGEIEAIGDEVKRFNIGDKVYGSTGHRFGTYAEYTCLPESGAISLLPENLNYQEAAAIPYGGLIAMHFLRGKIRKGNKVLIHGASGAIGSFAVQYSRYVGAEVTGVCGSNNKELVNSLGATKVIDYTKEDYTECSTYYDIVFDAAGKNPKNNAGKSLTCNGEYISVERGMVKRHVEDLAFINKLYESKAIRPVIDRIYSLEQAVDAHRYAQQRHKKGNVILAVV